MTIETINAAAAEPLDINGVKLSRRITSTDQDAELFRCMRTARETAEQITRRQLMVSRLRLTLDRFPGFGVFPAFSGFYGRGALLEPLAVDAIPIPRPPLVAIESITYVDTSGVTQSMNVLTDIVVDSSSEPARIFPAYGTVWPQTRFQAGAVKITFLAGFATVVRPDVSADTLTLIGPYRTYIAGDRVRFSNSGGALPGGLDEWTDYYVKAPSGAAFQVSLTNGGSAVDITDQGTGTSYAGVVPESIRDWIVLRAGTRFDNREEFNLLGRGESYGQAPFYDSLLNPWRVITL